MTPDPLRVSAIIRDVAESTVLPRFQKLAAHEISEKHSGDIVTIADKEAEHALSMALRDLLPGAAIVGEEGVAKNPDIMAVLSADAPVWIIDPVDGTQNFADGKPHFAMIVALVVGGKTIAGWIHEPIDNTTIWAIADEGAHEGGYRLKPQAPNRTNKFVGSLSRHYRERLERARINQCENGELPAKIIRYRCVGAEYAAMARGTLQFARYGGRLKPWDHAAGVLIHAECGGFSAMVETGEPYVPGPTLKERTLLLTPGEGSWKFFRDILEN